MTGEADDTTGGDEPVDIGDAPWLHPTVVIHGDVRLAPEVSLWPFVAIRAEDAFVEIGRGTNLQDHVVVHFGSDGSPSRIGEWCSITHHCTIHGATVGDDCLIGINATLMDGSVIGDRSIVAGHCIVTEGTVVPPDSVVAGVPGKVVATRDSFVANRLNAWMYRENAKAYARGEHRLWADPAFKARFRAERERLEREHGGTHR